ncbi:MAG TPA: phosphatidylserine decarboxylase family protein [Solirubrobacteraceae bacterium]|jgi:phosphatidylserine decarboxylase
MHVTPVTPVVRNYRVGEWLPSDHAILTSWLAEQVAKAERDDAPLAPVLVEFQDLIESNAELYMLFTAMFTQIPTKPPYNQDPSGEPQIRSYEQMLSVLNVILTTTPEFNQTGVVGFPINAILDWAMGTEAGYAAFLHPQVNAMLKKVLVAFGEYLVSPDSAGALNDDPETGWLGDGAMLAMIGSLPAVPGSGELNHWDRRPTGEQAKQTFAETFNCDPSQEHWGFGSWDQFFTRTFRDGHRPVAAPDDDRIVANACESAPYNLVRGVKQRDTFWIKGQPYSVQHMLDDDELVEKFVGGTVYQAFLSAKAYHRWHSPVSGTVVKTRVVEGTYYSEIPAEGFANPLSPDAGDTGPDPAAPNDSQGYISEVAARGMIFIDNPTLGIVGVLFIGMAEVSSCEFTVAAGDTVTKGQQLGMFHFGGSSHCLLFGPQVDLDFDLHGQAQGLDASNIPVRDRIAVLRS